MAKALILDSKGIALTPTKTGNASREHKKILYDLIHFIGKHYTDKINYDHLEIPIPKYPLPLRLKGHYYDLSFQYGERIILIDVQSLPFTKILRERADIHGKGKE